MTPVPMSASSLSNGGMTSDSGFWWCGQRGRPVTGVELLVVVKRRLCGRGDGVTRNNVFRSFDAALDGCVLLTAEEAEKVRTVLVWQQARAKPSSNGGVLGREALALLGGDQ